MNSIYSVEISRQTSPRESHVVRYVGFPSAILPRVAVFGLWLLHFWFVSGAEDGRRTEIIRVLKSSMVASNFAIEIFVTFFLCTACVPGATAGRSSVEVWRNRLSKLCVSKELAEEERSRLGFVECQSNASGVIILLLGFLESLEQEIGRRQRYSVTYVILRQQRRRRVAEI